MMLPFVSGKHKVIDKRICEYTGRLYATYQMKWLLQKGEDMSTTSGYHSKVNMWASFWPSERRVMNVDLLATDAEKAPYRSKHEVRCLPFFGKLPLNISGHLQSRYTRGQSGVSSPVFL